MRPDLTVDTEGLYLKEHHQRLHRFIRACTKSTTDPDKVSGFEK